MGLGAAHCAPPSRDAGLSILETVLAFGDETAQLVLESHLESILAALQRIAVGDGSDGKGSRKPKQVNCLPPLQALLQTAVIMHIATCVHGYEMIYCRHSRTV